MSEEKTYKVGYYTIYVDTTKTKTIYRVDSGKVIFIAKFKKFIFNPYRDVKEFDTLEKAKAYIKLKLEKKKKRKSAIIKKLPKSLYLILMKEESTGKIFVKVGITSKKHIAGRFSKAYGYEGYVIDTILRRIDSPIAAELESKIKDILNKKKSVKKYRPILESFSGYSECFDFLSLDEILKTFDTVVSKS